MTSKCDCADEKTKSVPLNFWFSNNTQQDEQNKKKVDEIMVDVHMMYYRFLVIDMSYDELIELRDKLIDAERRIMKVRCIFMYPRPRYLKEYIDPVNEKIKSFIPDWYKTAEITMDADDELNGYKLFDTDKNGSILAYDLFLKLEKLYYEPNVMTEDEFYKEYDKIACSDWSKQDEHGECFGGFWKYPDGSYEKENAYRLSREANGKALFKLPYSHSLIFETIKIGCGNRYESVRYSNFLCEYVKKIIELKPPDSPILVVKTKPDITMDILGEKVVFKYDGKTYVPKEE